MINLHPTSFLCPTLNLINLHASLTFRCSISLERLIKKGGRPQLEFWYKVNIPVLDCPNENTSHNQSNATFCFTSIAQNNSESRKIIFLCALIVKIKNIAQFCTVVTYLLDSYPKLRPLSRRTKLLQDVYFLLFHQIKSCTHFPILPHVIPNQLISYTFICLKEIP